MRIFRFLTLILLFSEMAAVSFAANGTPAGGRQAEIEEAVRSYRDSGDAPIIQRSNSIIYPYDESQPVVRCSPLRACDIELQAGEAITGVALGDTERWLTSPLESGEADRPVPHVIVKPTAYNLSTNLIIGTTRRTYHLGVISPSRQEIEDGELAYHRHVTFYYPSEMVQRWAGEQEVRRVKAARTEAATAAELAVPSVDELNFNYRLRGRKKIRWRPTAVFDDGRHVYIQLPAKAGAGDLPVLLVEAEGAGKHSGSAVVNYRVQGQWYVVDGLFEKAELVVGVGKHRKKVRIINRQWEGA